MFLKIINSDLDAVSKCELSFGDSNVTLVWLGLYIVKSYNNLINLDKLLGAQKVWRCREMTYNCSICFPCSTKHFSV